MRWPKEFKRVSGQKVNLIDTKILWSSISEFPYTRKTPGQFQVKGMKL